MEDGVLDPVGQSAQTGPQNYGDAGIGRDAFFKQGLGPFRTLSSISSGVVSMVLPFLLCLK